MAADSDGGRNRGRWAETRYSAKESTRPLFRYFDASKPLAFHISEERFEKLQLPLPRSLSLAQFVEIIQRPDGLYRYLSFDIVDQAWTEQLFPRVSRLRVLEGEEGFNVNLWLSTANVTAQLHYDESHNIFVHVKGKKTFYLLPPSEHWKLFIHPYLHPISRQSSLTFSIPPANSTLQFLQVTLGPGEMLYLPPYWFHMVVSETSAISVNVWSESKEGNVRQLMEKVPLPFDETWTKKDNIVALEIFIELLLHRVGRKAERLSLTDGALGEIGHLSV